MLNEDRQIKDSTLSVIDASGRQISLLNDKTIEQDPVSLPGSPLSHSSDEPTTTWMPPVIHTNNNNNTTDQNSTISSKRKYHCSEPGCNKSFTTR